MESLGDLISSCFLLASVNLVRYRIPILQAQSYFQLARREQSPSTLWYRTPAARIVETVGTTNWSKSEESQHVSPLHLLPLFQHFTCLSHSSSSSVYEKIFSWLCFIKGKIISWQTWRTEIQHCFQAVKLNGGGGGGRWIFALAEQMAQSHARWTCFATSK